MASLKDNYEMTSLYLNRIIAQQKYNIDEQCSICLCSMLNKSVIHIPCGHIFHNNCINTVFTSNCLTKYNCPLCRFDIYSALRKLGFPPLQREQYNNNALEVFEVFEAFEDDDGNFDTAIDILSSIIEVIGNSFSPVCFHNIISNTENILCQICKDAFINLTQTSENIDITTKHIIFMYNQQQDGIITLFDDIKYLFNFDENDHEYMEQIFPDYDISAPVNIPHH